MNKDISLSCADAVGVAEFKVLSDRPVPLNEDGEIKFSLMNSTPDMTVRDHLNLIRVVFDEINHRIWPLRIIGTSKAAEAYFKIYFVREDGKVYDNDNNYLFDCPYQFRPTTLAVQYANYGGPWSGHCFINDKFYFGLKHSGQTKDLVNILIHEVGGHGMGLNHTESEKDILNAIYDPSNFWTADSTRGILHIYGDIIKRVIKRDPRKGLIVDDKKVISFIKDLFIVSRRINRLSKSQMRTVLEYLGVEYKAGECRRSLKNRINEAL